MKAAILVLLLAGCSGVSMTDAERVACRDVGCSVWTEGELRDLVNRALRQGYGRGWTDSNRQGGRDL